MFNETVLVFSRNGMGSGPAELQQRLAAKFLTLTLESGDLPAKILFYTEGVRLVCSGSMVIDPLKQMEQRGVELVICSTCLEFLGVQNEVKVGVVGGMGDILTAMQMAGRVVSI
jgi:sulfur relay (sulfurtransferase) complex TusBCD TusD component (DsrE family)